MGRATRWLKGLFGKKKSGPVEDPNPNPKEKKAWGFARSFRDKERAAGKEGSEERRSVRREVTRSHYGSANTDASSSSSRSAVAVGDDQNKRAIAVAAATAAAAEAAVAAAQAAAVVVRLTSRGWVEGTASRSEALAAIRIQSVFRGYLARRALKALKGLVKLQALVRGHIVRKQAVETLRCMQALVRVQSRARAGRVIGDNHPRSASYRHHYSGPPTPEKYEPKARTDGAKPVRSSSFKRDGSKAKNMDTVDPNLMRSSGWNWLDRWMEERYWDSREALSRTGTATDDEKNEKILEVDAGKPYINPKWRTSQHSMCSPLTSDQNSRIFMATPCSPSKDSTVAQYSVPSPPSVGMQQALSPSRFSHEAEDVCESPLFYSASSRTGSSRRGPFTPSKSECSHSFSNSFGEYPNYMSYTESSKAKLRSHSAPRQRPEYEKSVSTMRSGAGDLSSASQRSSSLHLKFTGKAYPGSGRLDQLGMPIRNL